MNNIKNIRFWDIKEHTYIVLADITDQYHFLTDMIRYDIEDDYIVEYGSGCEDAIGVEIFENDILNDIHKVLGVERVFYSSGCFHVGPGDPFYNHVYSNSPFTLDSWEVIGNIHTYKENTNLI